MECSKTFINKDLLARDLFYCRFLDRQPRYFLLLRIGNCSCLDLATTSIWSKRKYSKKKRRGIREKTFTLLNGCKRPLSAIHKYFDCVSAVILIADILPFSILVQIRDLQNTLCQNSASFSVAVLLCRIPIWDRIL